MFDMFKRKRKKLKHIKFQPPGTRATATRNNLERHLKAFPADLCAFAAYLASGGQKTLDEIQLGSGAITPIELF